MNYYKINLEHFVALLTPDILRKPLYMAVAGAMIKPVEDVHDQFLNFLNLDRLTRNGQVFHIEKLLNDRFDYHQRRIRLQDGGAGVDVDVVVPAHFTLDQTDQADLKRILNENLMSFKTWQIIYL